MMRVIRIQQSVNRMPRLVAGGSTKLDVAEAPANLELMFSRPVSSSLPWRTIEVLFQKLGGDVSERTGCRVAVVLYGKVRVFHRPHPPSALSYASAGSLPATQGQCYADKEPLCLRP